MARKPIIAGNWKMNKNTTEAVHLSQQISNLYEREWKSKAEVILCPPSIDLKSVRNVLVFDKSPIQLGAQNVHWEDGGAFTGEISVPMLSEVGCSYCIVGHSERREMFGETDETVNLKVKALIAGGIMPIMCCGETLETREAGQTERFVCAQVRAGLAGLDAADVAKMVIAYEPIWAIGTGHVPTPEDADAICAAIRAQVADLFGSDTAEAIRILYGGSMKPANVEMFMPMPNIDGGLIGGASLKPDSFTDLIKSAVAHSEVKD
jgi:triosephosphate isomerase